MFFLVSPFKLAEGFKVVTDNIIDVLHEILKKNVYQLHLLIVSSLKIAIRWLLVFVPAIDGTNVQRNLFTLKVNKLDL